MGLKYSTSLTAVAHGRASLEEHNGGDRVLQPALHLIPLPCQLLQDSIGSPLTGQISVGAVWIS